jgi:arylsulfatase
VVLALIVALAAAACGPAPPTREGPGTGASVLLVVIETLRADALHCYGADQPVSPALDAVAAGGTLFERAVSASSYTAPSHASIMTSLYPREHTLGYGNGTIKLVRDRVLAEHLSRAGYDTAAFISNPILKRRIALDRGFAVYDDEFETRELNRPNFERTARDTTRRALDWLEERERPFFLWVHYQEPHGPYTPPEPYATMFDPVGTDDPSRPGATGGTRGDEAGGESSPESLDDATSADPHLDVLDDNYGQGGIPDYQRLEGLSRPGEYRARYRGEIRSLDDSIGELVAAATADGPTFVVITADHGEAFGENGFYLAHGHACTPDQSHVPLIVAGPGVQAQRRPELVGHVDIMPTILDLVGRPLPREVRGRSLRDTLVSGASLPAETYFCDAGFELDAYREGTFLRAQGPAWSAELDDHYKSGQANVDGDLLTEAGVGAVGTFDWSSTGPWTPAAADERLLQSAYAYWRGAVETAEQVEIPEDDLERLRALGYVDP